MTMKDAAEVPTPELDKRAKILDSGQATTVQDFYDWLRKEGYHLARYVEVDGFHDKVLQETWVDPERLMAHFFGIDQDKVEAERMAILEAIRK